MRVLITGACGFIGSHLVDYIYENFPIVKIYGTRYNPQVNLDEIKGKVELFECDVRNKGLLKHIIKQIKPDKIFHLAAQSYPAVSWKDPVGTINDNVLGTVNLFEAIRDLKLDPVILIAGSSAEYGIVTEENLPVKENHALQPLHPYGVSKVAQDLLGYQYFKNDGMKVIRARIFNTTGPRKIRDVCADFSRQIVRIENRSQEAILHIGNLETHRDITDGRDMVKALWIASEKAKFGEAYNFCSGRTIAINGILNALLKLTTTNIEIKQDTEKLRPTDERVILGDNSKLKRDIGWEPEISFDKTIKDTLAYWRQKFRKQ